VPEPLPIPSPHPTLRAPTTSGHAALAKVIADGLTATPKSLPPVLFYDRVGSLLFERICRTEEYYVTRTEREILLEHAAAIAAMLPREVTLAELGCGSAEKTEILLRTLVQTGHVTRFVACDVSDPALAETIARLRQRLPSLDVVPVLGDFQFAIAQAPGLVVGRCVWAFLGSSLGNLAPADARGFVASLRAAVRSDLLLGVDMVKPAAVLDAAYDDAEGVTAAFNRNVLVRINREFDADFVPQLFAHCALYRPEHQRVEMHLVSQVDQVVRIARLGLEVRFARGETIHTENSYKYTAADLARLAAGSGFVPRAAWTDRAGWFTVALLGGG
jgi:dimethylhistidine N-methyltransferase